MLAPFRTPTTRGEHSLACSPGPLLPNAGGARPRKRVHPRVIEDPSVNLTTH